MSTTKNLENVAEVRSLTNIELGNLKAAQAKTALKTLLSDPSHESQRRIEDKLDFVIAELQEQKEERKALHKEITTLREENSKQSEALMQHQRYLESLESEKRAENLIITGVPETGMTKNGQEINNDDDKCKLILEAIGKPEIVIKSAQRLGKPLQANSTFKRPIKVTLAQPSERKQVLEKAKSLKEAGDQFSGIYVKKDFHPMVRKELNRLRQVTKEEREKPENQGKTVRYDHETRKVLIDGNVIDHFRMAFF